MTTQRVTGYIRVSTDAQSDEGVSLDAQRAKIERWAAAYGRDLVAIHEDAGISGAKDADERPGLAAALADLAENRADALVIVKLDRLARSMRILVTLVEEVFRDKGLISLSESVDTTTAMGRAFVQFCGIMAELERGLICERTRAAMAHLKSIGVKVGAIPLGQRADGVDEHGRIRLVEDPEEQATRRRIAELRAEDRTLREIAEILTWEKRPTKRGGCWQPETIRRILATSTAGRAA